MVSENLRVLADSFFAKFETRMWRREKDAFLEHCQAEFARLGYSDEEITVRKDRNLFGLTSKNLLVGPPDADILITAHYDTPANNGILMAASPLVGTALSAVVLLIIFAGLGFLQGHLRGVGFLTSTTSIAIDILFFAVFAAVFLIKNKHNHSDNTSGVIGVFNMAMLVAENPDLRKKCAFVLFDHEEILPGLLGSRAFAKWRRKTHPDKANGRVINLDCIGNGDVLALMTRKKHEDWHRMADFFKGEGFDVAKVRGGLAGNSDHAVFPKGVTLLYQKRSLLGPLYIPRIHTRRDTVCDLEGIERLSASVYKYICDASGIPEK